MRFIGVLLMAGLLDGAMAAPKQVAPDAVPMTGERTGQNWIETPEGQEAEAIMQKAMRGEITNEEFVQMREAWRRKWVDGKGATSMPAPLVPDVKLIKPKGR